MQIGCNNVKIKYLLLQRLQLLRNVVTQILVAAINGICSVPNSSSELIFVKIRAESGQIFCKNLGKTNGFCEFVVFLWLVYVQRVIFLFGK